MTLFLVKFDHWVDDEEPGMRGAKAHGMTSVLIEASDENCAREIATLFEGVETNSFEGLNGIVALRPATEAEAGSTQKISDFRSYLSCARKPRFDELVAELPT